MSHKEHGPIGEGIIRDEEIDNALEALEQGSGGISNEKKQKARELLRAGLRQLAITRRVLEEIEERAPGRSAVRTTEIERTNVLLERILKVLK